MSDQTNGNELPASRLAAVEQGVLFFQEVAAERDRLRDELAAARTDNSALKVVAEALQAQLNDAESRVNMARLERDQMQEDLSVFRVLFQGATALMRAFEIEHAPLVRRLTPEQVDQLREQHRVGSGVERQQYGYNMGGLATLGHSGL